MAPPDHLDNSWLRSTVHSSSLESFDTSGEEGTGDVLEYFHSGNQIENAAKRYGFDKSTASHTDAYAVTRLTQGSHSTYISSPNVDFVPDLPTHSLTEEFCYYTDGMLGPFELLKWPQGYDAQEPHHMAAPINPHFFHFSDALTDCPPFLSREAGIQQRGSLPRRPVPELDVWEDPNAPWFVFTDRSWALDPFTSKSLGQLSHSIIGRLQAAVDDTNKIVLGKVGELLTDAQDLPAREHVYGRQLALGRAMQPLQSVLPLVEALQWFREVQRILLEMRAWYNYMAVIKPRIDAYHAGRGPSHPYPVLPLRGVFTSKQITAQTLYHAGVPVWCLRRLHTFNAKTQIGFWVQPAAWTAAFASTVKRTLGVTTVIAPTWSRGVVLDATSIGFTERLRRYSLFSRPIIRKPAAVLPELPPVVEYDTPVTMSDHLPVASTSGNISSLHTPQHHDVAPQAIEKKTDTAGGKRPSQRMLVQRADWHPHIHPAWASVEEIVRTIPDHDEASPTRLVYGFPPLHAFSGDVASKIHHWLRLRPHCYSAVFSQDGNTDIPILLSTSSWRVALEGHYYALPIPRGTQISSTQAEVAQLPKPPDPPAVTGKRRSGQGKGPKASSKQRSDAWKARRLAERIDIAVHFNINYGVPPYNPQLKPWPQWRNKAVDRTRVETDKVLWAEVVWELSIVHFRMDVIWFDLDAMADVFKNEACGDEGRELDLRMDRTNQWMQVWSLHGGSLHVGTDPAAMDWLVSTDWRIRRTGVARFSRLASHWPGMKLKPFSVENGISEEGFLAYEREVYEKYCRLYHAHRARLPTMPLTRPSTIQQDE